MIILGCFGGTTIYGNPQILTDGILWDQNHLKQNSSTMMAPLAWKKNLMNSYVFPKNRATPNWMVYSGKLNLKIDDLGGKPTIFGNIHKNSWYLRLPLLATIFLTIKLPTSGGSPHRKNSTWSSVSPGMGRPKPSPQSGGSHQIGKPSPNIWRPSRIKK